MKRNARKQRRLLHTSDLHLEMLNDSGCRSLEVVVNLAIEIRANVVLIAGDLFESNRVTDTLVSFALNQLQRLSVPVVILPGNHDCLVPESVYYREGLWDNTANARVLKNPEGGIVSLPDLEMSIWGKPITSYAGYSQPLSGIPQRRENVQWHIAIAHGYFFGPESRPWASFHITYEDIVSSRRDYVALGDSHSFTCICSEPVKACYSGSPSCASETVAIVDLVEGREIQVTSYSLRDVTG